MSNVPRVSAPTGEEPSDAAAPRLGPGAKLAVEAGPLIVFFTANSIAKRRVEDPEQAIVWATGAFMIAIIPSLLVSLRVERRIPLLPSITAIFVLVFGGLTLYLQDSFFIKIKATIVNTLFALVLGGGLLMGRSLLKVVLGEAIQLRDEGWRILTVRWIGFFLFLAAANEVVWRNFPDAWVAFKSFGVIPITLAFTLSQVPLMQRYQIEDADEATPSGDDPVT